MFDFSKLKPEKRNLRKVQLGAGSSDSKEYINLDYFEESDNIDVEHDLKEELPFDDNTIEEFYSHNVLEHLNHPDVTKLMKEVFRCLKSGGKFVSRLPDFENAARQFLSLPPGKKRDNMMICMYGGNSFGWEPPDAHKHFFGWTRETMKTQLIDCGFVVEKCESVGPDSPIPVIDFTAVKPG